MTKRSFDFKNISKSINKNIFTDREALKREITQKRDTLKRTLTDKYDGLKREAGDGRGGGIALTRTHKIAVAGVATLGAAAIAASLVPHDAHGDDASNAAPASYTVSSQQVQGVHSSVTSQHAAADQKAKAAEASQAAAKKDDAKSGKSKATKPVYANNLDGWIRHSLAIMKKHDIPGSYNGLYRNIIRESSGNPSAINNWDINAQNGIPSKGLLQVIPPTFKAYHVSGTSWNIYDPVANITAAANYAADRYGSMDNVNSAY
ncbi:transglycosylase SLT domain-containing protein [Streptomyces odontomachi]|uniref:transglycosylase SLT domain-containing protein n=1 Tax=Streptomyces odontomachi TaxID=2944940 RepID=UPI002108F4C5|nr:transglycosylase SLT domain-containing protein [Streptomyces sp. ODS25]